jgi:hypothetical protein
MQHEELDSFPCVSRYADAADASTVVACTGFFCEGMGEDNTAVQPLCDHH